MPNLVGCWRRDAEPSAPTEILGRQVASVTTGFRRYSTYSLSDGARWAAAMLDHGLLCNGDQPGRSVDGRWHVLVDGEILNLDELALGLLPVGLREGRGAASLCAEVIAHSDFDVLPRFNGLFVLVVWDSVKRILSLISDRYGFRPLFVRDAGDQVDFATELKGVIAAGDGSLALDATAVCEQLVYGGHFAGRTWLAGCQRLAPATILSICDAGTSCRSYWSYRYRYGTRAADQQTYFTRFAVLLDRAVERCMQGNARVGIFLSGGYDSRAVAASIRRHHLPIPSFTFGVPEARDVKIAPLLAARLGLQHAHMTDVGNYLRASALPIVWRTEGLLPFSGTTSIQFHDVLSDQIDIVLTGILGEFSGSHTWPALLLARTRRVAIEAIFERFVRRRVSRARAVMGERAFGTAFDELRTRFYASFERIDAEHPMDVADAWNVVMIQPGGTYHAPAVERHRFEVRAPHMDSELVDFLLEIPPLSRIEQRVYKKMIAYAYPEVRSVPCANSMREIEPRLWVEYPSMAARLVGRKLGAPLRRLAGTEDRLGLELGDLNDHFRAEPALRSELLEPLMAGGQIDAEVFSLDKIADLTEQQYSAQGTHAVVLSHVMSIGLAVRMLVQGDLSALPPSYYRAP